MKKPTFTKLISSDVSTLRNYPVAIIGGGGKSTLMLKLGEELTKSGRKVILTSTTKFQPSQKTALVLQKQHNDYLEEAEILLKELNLVAIGSDYYGDNRISGVNQNAISQIRALADVILIEADGSRQRGLKTHKEHEPVIPPGTRTTIVVASAETVGRPLNEQNVHRADLFSKKWEIPLESTVTPEIMARELLSPYSYLKNIPINSNVAIFVNKADRNKIGAKLLAERLMRSCDYPIFMGSLKTNRLKRVIPKISE